MSQATSRRRFADVQHRWGLLFLVMVLVACLWALVLWFSSLQRERLITDSARELSLMNRAVAQQANNLLSMTETNLRTMDLWLHAHPGIDPLVDKDFAALINEMRRTSGDMIDFRVVSEQGQMYFVPSPERKVQAEVGDRDYFKAHFGAGARPDMLHIDKPLLSRATYRWVIPVSWRVTSPVRDAAVLVATINLEHLSQLHDRVRFKPEGTIVLVRTDGVVMSRTPFDAKYAGMSTASSPTFQSEYGAKRNGSFMSEGQLTDGIHRLVSYERLDDHPMTVLVTRELNEVLDPFHARRRVIFGVSGVVSLVALLFSVFLQRSQRALHTAQQALHRLATTDHLTEVMNRRALSESAQREFGRAQRFDRDVTVLALDIDHFKRVNDSLGHAAGDQVLQACAQRWAAALRGQDLLGRLGGEEFCVVLPETSIEAAEQVAERLRQCVQEPPLAGAAQITVSIGVSGRRAGDAQWTALLERADQALYRAKADGRNRVRLEK